MEQKTFEDGILCAAQVAYIDRNEETLSEMLIIQAFGTDRETAIKAQLKSGFEDDKMVELINSVFDKL